MSKYIAICPICKTKFKLLIQEFIRIEGDCHICMDQRLKGSSVSGYCLSLTADRCYESIVIDIGNITYLIAHIIEDDRSFTRIRTARSINFGNVSLEIDALTIDFYALSQAEIIAKVKRYLLLN